MSSMGGMPYLKSPLQFTTYRDHLLQESSVLILKLALFKRMMIKGMSFTSQCYPKIMPKLLKSIGATQKPLFSFRMQLLRVKWSSVFTPKAQGEITSGYLVTIAAWQTTTQMLHVKDDTRSNMATFVGKCRYIFPTWSIWVIFEA